MFIVLSFKAFDYTCNYWSSEYEDYKQKSNAKTIERYKVYSSMLKNLIIE